MRLGRSETLTDLKETEEPVAATPDDSARRTPNERSAAVELHDELLLDGQLDVLALGQGQHLAAVLLGVELEPVGDAAAPPAQLRGPVQLVLLAAAGAPAGLPRPHLGRRDEDLPPVDGDVAV